ncbi:polysaccharide pyruvyl transferase family protein [Rhodobacteraceae bacterium NNCM2]|nr:polysaccharide pyruvyl transferase family protein [Coraliihabitans acroporae]
MVSFKTLSNMFRGILKGEDRAADPSATNYFHAEANNIGDRCSGPSLYFPFERMERRSLDSWRPGTRSAIFGGGLIFGQIDDILRETPRSAEDDFVAWGIGIPPRGLKDDMVEALASRFRLFGVRNYDWRDRFDFVPCASCMIPLFDREIEPEHNYVVYAHKRKTPFLMQHQDAPVMDNKHRSLEEVLDFLSSGEIVVTSSYHGVYWAQLLGRRVLCIPYSRKFRSFEHPPMMSDEANWERDIKLATKSAPILGEYRELNRRFFEKYLNRLR